ASLQHLTHNTSQFASVLDPILGSTGMWLYSALYRVIVVLQRPTCPHEDLVHSHWPPDRLKAASFTESGNSITSTPRDKRASQALVTRAVGAGAWNLHPQRQPGSLR